MTNLTTGTKGYIATGEGRTERGFIMEGKPSGKAGSILVGNPLDNIWYEYEEPASTLVELTEDEYNELYEMKSDGEDSEYLEEQLINKGGKN